MCLWSDGRHKGVTFLPSLPPSFQTSILSPFYHGLCASASEWVPAIFRVRTAFINIPLLGDRLMSPGSSDCDITTFSFFCEPLQILLVCYITVGAPNRNAVSRIGREIDISIFAR